jgi:hypothetical protein
MSIIFSLISVANHSGSKIHKQITYLIAISFACMWVALLVQKISICIFHSCHMGKSVALSLLISQYLCIVFGCYDPQIIGNSADVTADASLVAAPLYLLKNVGLSRSKKILVQSAFGASLLITAVTIPHSTLILYDVFNSTTLMFAHIKVSIFLSSHCYCKMRPKLDCPQSHHLQPPGDRVLLILRILERHIRPVIRIQWRFHECYHGADG